MSEDRNIAEEFAQARKSFINRLPDARPYNRNLGEDNKEIVDLLESYGIHPKSKRFTQVKKYSSGSRDILVSNIELGYLIKDRLQPEGTKTLLDGLIVNEDNAEQTRFFLNLYRQICEGKVKYARFERGSYGAVGIHPTTSISSQEITRPDICIKYFNYAFPYSPERWKKSLTAHDKIGEAWNLSGVTGLGNYLALRYLKEGGLPTPKVYLATSELLIQEYIDGYTIANIKDHYEELKAAGVLGEDDTIIDGIWDFADEYIPKLTEAVKRTIEPIRNNYWAPDFQHYDVNMGNIMIKKDGLRDPKNNFVIIDPLR